MTDSFDFRRMADEEHRRAEVLRLDTGQAGCGCGTCQSLYRTLDLSQYGARVKRHDGVIYITGRMSQEDDEVSENTVQNGTEAAQGSRNDGDTIRQGVPVGGKDAAVNMSTLGKQYVLTPGLSTIIIDEVSEIATDGGQTTQGKDSVRHKISCDTSQGQALTQKAIKGRKPMDLPVEKVLELSASGKSIREVADETLISRETVRRIVNGQRVLVEAIR